MVQNGKMAWRRALLGGGALAEAELLFGVGDALLEVF
jgi:hypothetical protein